MAVEELKEKAKDKVKEMQEKVNEIQEDLDNFKEKILSKEEREKKLNEMKERVENAKEELKEKADTLKDSATEKFQTTLDSLNKQINLALAVLKNDDWSSDDWAEKKWFFKSIGDWFSEKWDWFKEKDTKWKAVTVWAWVLGVWLFATLFSKKARERRKQRREERKAEREAKREERRAKRKERWNKFLTRLWVGALFVWWGYALKKGLDKRKEKSENLERKMDDLRWFEARCKELKEKADECLEKSHYFPTLHRENQKNYEKIKAEVIKLKNEAIAILAEVSASDAKDDVKTEAEELKGNIDDYLNEIEGMESDIYSFVPKFDDWSDDVTPTPETPTETTPEPAETEPESATETPTETSPEPERKTPETELWKLRWFESQCKELKEKANDCLNVSRSWAHVVDYEWNKRNYEEILANILDLQGEATVVFEEMSRFRLRNRVKTEMEDLKKRIDDYVEEVKTMKWEIDASVPEPWITPPLFWGVPPMWEGPKPTPETPTETEPETPTEAPTEAPTESEPETAPEILEPVSATVLTNAAMDYLDVIKEEIPVGIKPLIDWNGIKAKAKNVFQDYFKEHPILKKSESKKMVFEIDNPSAFWNMFKQVYDKSLSERLRKRIDKMAPSFANKIKDISKTLRDANVKTYEDIAFPHFWTLIANAVKAENWTMTVQSYYDWFSKAFPNKNATQIERDLASSGQADKDIKDLRYPFA